jgi:hypothetical protein
MCRQCYGLPQTKTFAEPNTIIEYLMRENHSSWNGSCLEWLPAKHDGGYGLVWIDSRIWRVTVVVWTLEVGPPKNDVLHKCHNPMCFLFDHLYDGTESQNGLDMVRAGRVKNQYDIPSYDVVSRVRSMYATGKHSQRALAKMFGISQQAVWRYVNGMSRTDA